MCLKGEFATVDIRTTWTHLTLLFRYFREAVLELGECSHTTVIKDMCAECGADLRQDENVID